MNADDFRAAALKAPGAIEASHMNHPDFRVNGKIFASLGYPDDDWGMVKLTPEQQCAFLKKSPEAFRPCNGAWGINGATNVHLASIGRGVLREALTAAAQNITNATRPAPTSAKRNPSTSPPTHNSRPRKSKKAT